VLYFHGQFIVHGFYSIYPFGQQKVGGNWKLMGEKLYSLAIESFRFFVR
jgi:hypothetical protein